MITYIELNNFKSLKHLKFDLCKNENKPKKMAFIYGENGSGKSNLILSLLFLSKTLTTLTNQESIKDLNFKKIGQILDKINNPSDQKNILNQIFRHQYTTLKDIFDEFKSLGNESPLSMEIGFFIDENHGNYKIIIDKDKVITEELNFKKNKRMGSVFSLNKEAIKLSPFIFTDTKYKNELEHSIEQYWGKHTFMSILFNELEIKNKKYINKSINKNLNYVLDWFKSYYVLCKASTSQIGKVSSNYTFLHHLQRGIVDDKDNKELMTFEKIINTFFTKLYSDIKKVYYKFYASDDKYRYELYFKKLLNGQIIEIPFSLESSGTQKILDIFPFIFLAISGKTVFVDETDAGIHDILMYSIIESFIEAMDETEKGQFVVTTHNTLLMKQLPADNVYILDSNVNGDKSIRTIGNYDFRTQKANNIQNKYLDGSYGGVPFVGYLDLIDLFKKVNKKLF